MKKILVSLSLLLVSFVTNAISVDAQLLKDKLATFDNISATFVQRVNSSEGKLLNESRGEVTISRPGKFHWFVKTPEEDLIVSNGETIWYYSPFIEQVTLINFTDAVNGTPFALLAGATKKQWENYIVEKEGELFTVTNPNQQQATTFVFEFNNTGNIAKFVVIEEQGQLSEFVLTHKIVTKPVADSLYEFKIPAGVEVDDQR
ncbi:MAG: outer membrane lipoprotein chaperone LolA [Psychromonas sp.]|nr:outer membrane lipoprotein chaperone LolA [Alteromonadales bacterium]MCP5079743.1 outer membrane lipoprotein chaperone LolA [Psychromonas sp.]